MSIPCGYSLCRVPTIPSHLRYFRKARGLNQEDVERELGFSQSTVSKWESEKETALPDLSDASRLAALYGISVNDFVTGPSTLTHPVTAGTKNDAYPARLYPEGGPSASGSVANRRQKFGRGSAEDALGAVGRINDLAIELSTLAAELRERLARESGPAHRPTSNRSSNGERVDRQAARRRQRRQ